MLLQHINTEVFRVLISLSSPCEDSCQRMGKKVGGQRSRCQMAPHWLWHLDGRLACLRDSWPTALLSIQTAVYLFKSPTTVCVYFGKLLFLGQRFPWHFCICWHRFYIQCIPHAHPLLHFSFLIKIIAYKWKCIKRRKICFWRFFLIPQSICKYGFEITPNELSSFL